MTRCNLRTAQNHGESPMHIRIATDGTDDTDAQRQLFDQHYRQLLDHCPDVILVHESGRLVYVNPAGVKALAATSPDELLGRRITEFVHPNSVPDMMARIGSLRDLGDTSSPAQETLLTLDGATLDVEATSALTVWNGDMAYLVVLRDLSRQKAAEKALRYQAALVNHVSDAVIATTHTGIVTSWNPAAEAIYRRPAADALARPVSEAVGAPLCPHEIVADGGLLHTTHRTSDGVALAVQVAVTAMDNGFVLVCSDESVWCRAEQLFQSVISSLVEGVVVLSPDGCAELVNPAALRILGIDSSDSLYDPAKRVAKVPIYDRHGRVVSSNPVAIIELLRTRVIESASIFAVERPCDGQLTWLSANIQLLEPDNPQTSSVLICFREIDRSPVVGTAGFGARL
ncbi:PAS domain S-box protein [Mycobacterium simiae]|uniref:PAS domain S-box protein n=1 Tax=Mycobacterium simiae TaxID=1784 RepID=A0A5B1BIW3_MYCSI|nr:PAS domain S-box protein [Mycobacterium simiae]KAA1248597.1 PAS domain S-box protein [Mycobacterium simiae]